MSETTTIEITKQQKEALKSMGYGSYKAALQELIEGYNSREGIGEARIREIAREEINENVVMEALE